MPVFDGGPVDGKRTHNVEYVNEAVPYTPEVDGRPMLEQDGREMFGYYQGNPGQNLTWVDVGSPEQWEQMRLSQAVNIIIDGGQLAALDIANGLLDIPKGAISGLVGVANAMLDLRSSDPAAAVRTAQRAASVRNVISNPSIMVRAALEPLRQMFDEGSVRGIASYVGGAAISAGGAAVVNSVASRGAVAADISVVTGGRRAIPYWDHDAAELFYNVIRADSSDIAAIARNAGMSESRVSRIKDHVFFREHRLDDGLMRFQADPEMANAWSRLTSGNHLSSDIKLLNHEIFESKFEGIFKTDYRTAHDAAIRSGRVWIPGE